MLQNIINMIGIGLLIFIVYLLVEEQISKHKK
jgi:hypothetical protein